MAHDLIWNVIAVLLQMNRDTAVEESSLLCDDTQFVVRLEGTNHPYPQENSGNSCKHGIKVRVDINAHLYPVLATVATVFLGIGMISTLKANHKLGVIAEQAALFNSCVAVHLEENSNYVPDEVVSHCNGGPEPTAR